MIGQDIKNSVFELFKDEFDVNSFSKYELMLKTFIVYKYKVPVESYLFEDSKFRVIECTENDEPLNASELKNCFVIGGKQIYEPKYVDEIITGFINMNIGDDKTQYSVYVNEENRVVHLYRGDQTGYVLFNLYTERVICAIITRLFPWYFKDIPKDVQKTIAPMFIDDTKIALFDSIFEDVINDEGILKRIMHNKMVHMGERIIDRKTNGLKNNVDSNKARISDLINEIFTLNKSTKNLQQQIMMIELGVEELKNPINEIIDFIESTKEDIKITDIEEDSIIFEMRTVLDQYNKEDFNTHLNSSRSYWYEDIRLKDDDFTHDEIKDLYYNILTPGTGYRVWCSTKIELNIIDAHIKAKNIEQINSMPHPHLNGNLSCFGTAGSIIAEYVISNRFVEALNQILYASKQYTIPDGAGPNFVSGISNYDCIECPDGNYRNANDTLAYMRKLKEDENDDRCEDIA